MSIILYRLHFSLVLFGIFLLSPISGRAEYASFSSDTMRHEMSWFDKNDTIQFFPVCGTDGNTYLNTTEARFFGVNSWTEGRCNTYEEVLSFEPNAFWLEEITLNDVSNTSSSSSVGFSDYTNIVLEVFKNKENQFSYKSNAFDKKTDSNISIWIDFNKNGAFEKSELLGKENISAQEGNLSFQIPSTTESNLMTRMRIVCSTLKEDIVSRFIEKGEVEDYTIIIVE